MRVNQQIFTIDDCIRLQSELVAANDALIAARAELAALKADRTGWKQEYATTQRFHQAADLEVTAEEDEAFAELAKRLGRVESAYMLQQGRINTMADKLDAMRAAL